MQGCAQPVCVTGIGFGFGLRQATPGLVERLFLAVALWWVIGVAGRKASLVSRSGTVLFLSSALYFGAPMTLAFFQPFQGALHLARDRSQRGLCLVSIADQTGLQVLECIDCADFDGWGHFGYRCNKYSRKRLALRNRNGICSSDKRMN